MVSYSGIGNIPNEINPGTSCLLQGEINDVWYTFTTQFAGNLSFTITPNDPNDDYDWAVYNLTNANCSQIYNNPSLEVGCNYSPNIGCGGTTGPNGNTTGPCGAQNGPVIPVLPGQTFVINVSNFSSTQFGYSIDFTSSTGSIFDIYPPSVSVLPALTCGTSTVDVTFYENVTCSSVQPSDFTLTGPGGPYTITGVSAAACALGGVYDKTFTLTFSPAILVGGNYTLTIVNAVNDLCGNASATNVSYPMVVSAPTLTPAHTDVQCNGDLTGTVNIQVTGGTSPFSYQWMPNVSSTNSAANLAAGTYTVTVTGTSGCPATSTVVVAQPAAVALQNQNVIQAVCGGATGAINVTAGGGTAPYAYQWSNGALTQSITNVYAGVYTLTVTDANSCTMSQTFNVTAQNTLNAVVGTIQNVSCFGSNNGSLAINPSGGSGSYTYQWSGGVSVSNIASNLPGGSYTVTVTDGPCVITLSNIVVIEPVAPLSSNPILGNTSCGNANGTCIINASGGTPVYTYQWSTGASGAAATGLSAGTYTVTITDANSCTHIQNFNIAPSTGPQPTVNYLQQTVTCYGSANGSATVNANGGVAPIAYSWTGGMGTGSSKNNLPAGNYTVTVLDNAGCSATVPVTINTPLQLTAVVGSFQHVKCFGQATGSAVIAASGGTGLLQYTWSPVGGNAAIANNLSANNYTVLVTDANGCSATVPVTISQPALPLQGIISSSATTCGNVNGSVSLSTSGGTLPYSYLWSNGNVSSSINSLAAGTYTCTVTDANLCSTVHSINIASSSAVNIVNASVQDLTCAGVSTGSISVLASGGVLPYLYNWSAGGSTNNVISNLAAGSYSITITDNAGCTTQANYVVASPPAMVINLISQQNVNCFGGSNGSLSLNTTGGMGSLNYQWSPAVGTSANVTGLTSKTYSVVVSDQNNCSVSQSYYISQPAVPLVASINIVHTTCGLANGNLTAIATGGTFPYLHTWTGGATTASLQNIQTGNYTVTVTDANGCVASQNAVVLPSTAVVVSASSFNNVLCHGGHDGDASVYISGGIIPYSYMWSNGQTQPTATALTPGNYSVTVTDSAGCTVSSSFVISQPAAIQIVTPATQTVCKNQSVTLVPTVNGGAMPYTYLWSTGANSLTLVINPLSSQSYTLTVTDANGCTKNTAPVSVYVYPPLAVAAIADTTICQGNRVAFTASALGGNGIYQYNWGNGFGSNHVYSAVFNTSSVLVLTALDGCAQSASDSFNVAVIPNPQVMFTVAQDSGCVPFDVDFTNQTLTVPNSVWQWSFGNGSFSTDSAVSNVYAHAGQYNVSLTVTTPAPQLCAATYQLSGALVALEKPQAQFTFTPTDPNILSALVEFQNQSTYAWLYRWSFGDGSTSQLQNPWHAYATIGISRVMLTASNNFCYDSAIAEINVTDNYSFYAPNAFSPDGDGKNETFTVYGTNIVDANIAIYNRWGQQVFSSKGYPFFWNGALNNTGSVLPQGVYVYVISTVDKFGGRHSNNGRVNLVK